MGNFVKPELTANNYSGVYFLCKETERLLPIIEHWKEYSVLVEAQITSRELKHIECSGDRSGYMIYKSNHKVIF